MRVENRFNAIAHDPVDRLIRVHAASLANAVRNRRCSACAPACREADARQCRIVINALRREIDRLMRGVDRFDLCPHLNNQLGANHVDHRIDRTLHSQDGAESARRSPQRKTYAVNPIGQTPPILIAGADSSAGAIAANGSNAVAIGSVLDVVA